MGLQSVPPPPTPHGFGVLQLPRCILKSPSTLTDIICHFCSCRSPPKAAREFTCMLYALQLLTRQQIHLPGSRKVESGVSLNIVISQAKTPALFSNMANTSHGLNKTHDATLQSGRSIGAHRVPSCRGGRSVPSKIRWPSNMQTAGRGGGVCFLLSAQDTMVSEFDR